MSECSLRHCGKLRKFQVSTRRTLRVRVTHALRCVSALRIARWGSLEGPRKVYRHLEVGGREPFVQPKHREDESGPVYRGAQGAMHREIECVAPDFPGSVV